jgi:hypothetical protein
MIQGLLSQLNMLDLKLHDFFPPQSGPEEQVEGARNDSGVVSSKNSARWTI